MKEDKEEQEEKKKKKVGRTSRNYDNKDSFEIVRYLEECKNTMRSCFLQNF